MGFMKVSYRTDFYKVVKYLMFLSFYLLIFIITFLLIFLQGLWILQWQSVIFLIKLVYSPNIFICHSFTQSFICVFLKYGNFILQHGMLILSTQNGISILSDKMGTWWPPKYNKNTTLNNIFLYSLMFFVCSCCYNILP